MIAHHFMGYSLCLILTLSVCGTCYAKERSGAQIYKDICSSCHENGDFDAPRLKDFSAWQLRLAKGKKELYQSAFNGFGDNMPARDQYEGHLTDKEIYAAVNYMLKKTMQYSNNRELIASTGQ